MANNICTTATTGPAGPVGPSGLTPEVTQAGHGFATGDAIYYTGSAWAKAKADVASTLAVALADVTDVNTFNAKFSGEITGLSGLTAGQYYYVSEDTAGELTSTEPALSNPILLALTTTSGMILPWRPVKTGEGLLIDELSNVTVTLPQEGDVLIYDSDSSGPGWVNADLETAGINIIGDATDYIRLNESTGRIEFGGTMRPWFDVHIGAHYETTAVALWINAMGDTERFQDGVLDYMNSHHFIVPDNWDFTDDIVVSTRGRPNGGNITSGSNVWYGSWRIYRMQGAGSGSTINNPTSTGVADTADTSYTIADTTQYHPMEISYTFSAGSNTWAAGDYMQISLRRDASNVLDTLGQEIYGITSFKVRGRLAYI